MKDNKKFEFDKVYDKRKKLFGIKAKGQKDWYVTPMFEALETIWVEDKTWFKQNGKYGYYSILDKRVLIPAIYGYPLFFDDEGYAIAWKNYKAGVINLEGDIAIPFIYDNIERRYQRAWFPKEEQQGVITGDDEELHTDMAFKDIFYGYACFTNEGGKQAYDAHCQPDEFKDWEREQQNRAPEYDNKEVETMSLNELEETIKKEYQVLLELGYEHHKRWTWSEEHRNKVNEQEEKVMSLIIDRRYKMDRSWVHNVENAKRIGRMNRLLTRAVRKAIKLGKKTAKSLQWMTTVSNSEYYDVKVYVHPEWQNSKSDLRYERKFKSSAKEFDRLIDEEDNVSDTHIWNIIASLARCAKYNGIGSCFDRSGFKKFVVEYDRDYWDEREMLGDDGRSWDELIHYPAYQDEYFTLPFHHLYCDCFEYSFEDLCNINDFRVNVNVRLVTKEHDR